MRLLIGDATQTERKLSCIVFKICDPDRRWVVCLLKGLIFRQRLAKTQGALRRCGSLYGMPHSSNMSLSCVTFLSVDHPGGQLGFPFLSSGGASSGISTAFPFSFRISLQGHRNIISPFKKQESLLVISAADVRPLILVRLYNQEGQAKQQCPPHTPLDLSLQTPLAPARYWRAIFQPHALTVCMRSQGYGMRLSAFKDA